MVATTIKSKCIFNAHRRTPLDVTRRSFIGALGAGAPLAASQKSAGDRIVAGCIGVGSQGLSRLNELLKADDVRVAAICDVDQRHLDRAIALVERVKNYKPQAYRDFRKLLEDQTIDAVTVVTPDHWHALPSVAAFQAGKDVYCEKPLSYSVAEGRAMADGSLKYKRVTQMGNHIHNDRSNYRRVVEMVRSGGLGKITRVHAWKTSPTQNVRTNEPPTCPAELDYDFWLGPAPKRSYDPLRSHGNFRQFWDYSGGSFIDFWCHIADVAFWAMDFKAPKAISSVGGRFFRTDSTEASDTQEAILEFPGVLFTYSFRPTPLTGFEHMGSIGCVFEGTEASLVTNYQTHEVWVKGRKVPDFPRPSPSIPDSPGHMREFLDAVKSRNLETTCNFRYGHRLSKYGLLANIAYRTGRRLIWDDVQERIAGGRAANHFLTRRFRKPWKFPHT